MPVTVKNLDFIRGQVSEAFPDLGPKLAEALQSLADAHNIVEQQTNSNSSGNPLPPPAINALNVKASNGHFQVSINHEGAQFYRGVQYYVEHADNANFIDSHTEELGTTRNANLFLGNSTRYFRAYAAYDASHPGAIIYHGTGAVPRPVTGGGSVPGPSFLPSQGSGTGKAGQGLSGPGPIAFRTATGKPPVR